MRSLPEKGEGRWARRAAGMESGQVSGPTFPVVFLIMILVMIHMVFLTL